MNKSIVRLSAVAAAALMLTGCATAQSTGTSNSTDSSSFAPTAKLSGNLSISGFTSTTDEVASSRFAVAKKAVGSGVTVKSDETAFDTQAFLAAVAGGSAPDLIYVDRDSIGTLAAKNAIEPLTACMSGEGIKASTFDDTAMSQVTLAKKVYGVPEFGSADVVIADSKLLDAAGVTISDVDGSNWDAMSAAAKKLAVVNGKKVKVLGVDTKLPEFFPLWAQAQGVNIVSSDGKKADLNDPKIVSALTYAAGIYAEEGGYSAVKAAKDASDFFGKGNQYATDTIGASPLEQWYVNVLSDVSPKASLAFTTFKSPEGKTISYSTGSAWAIPVGSKNQAAACRFLNAMTETSTWVTAAQTRIDKYKSAGTLFTGLLTANKDADIKVKAMITPTTGAFQDAIDATYAASAASFTVPGNPAAAEVTTAWTDGVNRVLTGQANAQDSLDQAQKEAQSALDTAWASFGK